MKESRNKKNSSTEMPTPGVEFGQLEKLLDFMASHGLEEFEYEHGGLRIRLKKASASANAALRAGTPPQAMPVPPAAAGGVTPHLAATAAPPSSADVPEELHTVKSHMVGPFDASSRPGASPCVK